MKLLTIANRYYLIALSLVFVLGSVMAYVILRSIINREFNRKLFAEKEQLVEELHQYEDLRDSYFLNIGDRIDLQVVDFDPDIAPSIRDTIMYDIYEMQELPFRILTFSDRVEDRYYRITITKSLLPNQDLIEGISEIMLAVFFMLASMLVLLNRLISKKVWGPFYRIVRELRSFDLTHPKPLQLPQSKIQEFNELNQSLGSMIQKSITDYQQLKEYTENTTHELQTPLAIIQNKAEMLLQRPLPEEVLEDVGKIYDAATRVSKLKEALSLLNKIENNQFAEVDSLALKAFILKKLKNFEELIALKNLDVNQVFYADPVVRINNTLAYILITNLLNNAIKHNDDGGKIRILLKDKELSVQNTGPAPRILPEEVFDRFKRSSSTSSESTGLGLALVKKITEVYSLKITYTYLEGWHHVNLDFESILDFGGSGIE